MREMSEEQVKKDRLQQWAMISFVVVLLLSSIAIMMTTAGQASTYSAYSTDTSMIGSTNVPFSDLQLTEMKESLGECPPEAISDCSFLTYGQHNIANTMSTPMLVNDWLKPHRTLLVIISPEKPFDQAEADLIYDFVVNRGGKVIIAGDGSNSRMIADRFGLQFTGLDLGEGPTHGNQYQKCLRNLAKVSDCEDADNRINEEDQVWALAAIRSNVEDMGANATSPCSNPLKSSKNRDNCVLPVLFDGPTSIEVLQPDGTEAEIAAGVTRTLHELAVPSAYAVMKLGKETDWSDSTTAQEHALIVRIDYSKAIGVDIDKNNTEAEIEVTGSIVFVADDESFSNMMWDGDSATAAGFMDDCSLYRTGQDQRRCWTKAGGKTWTGNEEYFRALIEDMFLADEDVINAQIMRNQENFNIVFDESRHASNAVSSPFVEAMSTVVLVTSDAWLKWLILGNLMLLILLGIMIVPAKENWRHVFDLTRFRERPNKIAPADYKQRVRDALFTTVRLRYDLTRDQMALKAPAEVQQMIADPRLIELVYSQRDYAHEELQELLKTIRRWDKE